MDSDSKSSVRAFVPPLSHPRLSSHRTLELIACVNMYRPQPTFIDANLGRARCSRHTPSGVLKGSLSRRNTLVTIILHAALEEGLVAKTTATVKEFWWYWYSERKLAAAMVLLDRNSWEDTPKPFDELDILTFAARRSPRSDGEEHED